MIRRLLMMEVSTRTTLILLAAIILGLAIFAGAATFLNDRANRPFSNRDIDRLAYLVKSIDDARSRMITYDPDARVTLLAIKLEGIENDPLRIWIELKPIIESRHPDVVEARVARDHLYTLNLLARMYKDDSATVMLREFDPKLEEWSKNAK